MATVSPDSFIETFVSAAAEGKSVYDAADTLTEPEKHTDLEKIKGTDLFNS